MEANKWDELIDNVQNGLMTPAEAEAEAAHAGLDPLESAPDPDDFDPLKETWWTLPMAVAWISRRDVDAVRNAWEAYTSECRYWVFREWRVGIEGPTTRGHFLEYRMRPSLLGLTLSDRVRGEDDAPAMPAAAAKEALWIALREGFFEATGLVADTDKRAPIPSLEWQDLQAIEVHGREVLTAGRSSYRDVRVRSRSVVGSWPQVPVVTKLADLPPVAPPAEAGYMPLYCAAQWIATKGNRETIDPLEPIVWQQPYAELLARIASEDVKVIGARDGQREPIPGYHFAGCRVDYPHAESTLELMLSEELYLRSYPYSGEKAWFSGFDDALQDRRGTRWNRIQVHQPDILRFWPFGRSGATPQASDRTGAPGRPTSMHLIRAELEARGARGDVASSLNSEATALVAWFASAHPLLPCPSRKTVLNGIRAQYRNARTQK